MLPKMTRSARHTERVGFSALRSHYRRVLALLAISVCCLPLTACAGFFVTPTSTTSTTTTTTTSNSGDFAYVANSTAGTTYLSEYSIGSNTLNAVGTISLGYIPVALAVSPNNSFLYVASVPGTTSPGVYVYNIGSTGELTAVSSSPAAIDTVGAMAISPDGNWLYTVNVDGITMIQYQVNTSTGALTVDGETTLPGSACNLTAATPVSPSCSVAVSPSGQYLMATLGASGDIVYSYSSSGGINGSTAQEIPSGYSVSNPTGDFSVAFDANNYAYIARTSSLGVYAVGSGSVPEVSTLTYAAGSVPRSVTLTKSYSYVYTADEGAGTIAGFGIGGNGSLTAVTGSTFAGPPNVAALAVDNTGDYMVAVGYDANTGVRLYTISSAGVLSQVAASGSGSNSAYPALVAMTH